MAPVNPHVLTGRMAGPVPQGISVVSGRVRTRGHWSLFSYVFVLLSRVPIAGRWLPWALAWPVHRWIYAIWIDGERI